MEEDRPVKTGDVSVWDLVPCCAACCCIFSMYTVLPDCCGSVFENVICCLSCKLMTCKPSKEQGVMCKLLGADCDCVPFKVCCQVGSGAGRYSSLIFLLLIALRSYHGRGALKYAAWIREFRFHQLRKFRVL